MNKKIENCDFDFGFWKVEEDNEPKNDSELLQKVRQKLNSGEITIDLLSQHEYELVLSADFQQFSENAQKYLKLNAPFDPKLHTRTPTLAHFLSLKNQMTLQHANKLQRIRKEAKEDKIKRRKQIIRVKKQMLIKNKQIVKTVKVNRQIAAQKFKSHYTYNPPDEKLMILFDFLQQLNNNYQKNCENRQKIREERKKRDNQVVGKWKLMSKFVETLVGSKSDDLLATAYGRRWLEKFRRTQAGEIAAVQATVRRDIEAGLAACISKSQGQVNLRAQNEMDIESNVEEAGQQVCVKNLNNFTEDDFEQYDMSGLISDSVRQKLLSIAIKIKQKCKEEIKFDSKLLLKKWLRSQKRETIQNDWYRFYLDHIKNFNEYLKLAFELNINDSNITLQELSEMKLNLNKPKYTIYKDLPKTETQSNVRKQHQREINQIATRNSKLKSVKIPPKYPQLVKQVRKRILHDSKIENPRSLNSETSGQKDVSSIRTTVNLKQPKSETAYLDAEFLKILDELISGIDVVKYQSEDLVKTFVALAQSLVTGDDPRSKPEATDCQRVHSGNPLDKVQTKHTLLEELKRKRERELQEKQLRVKHQRAGEQRQLEARQLKFSVTSKPKRAGEEKRSLRCVKNKKHGPPLNLKLLNCKTSTRNKFCSKSKIAGPKRDLFIERIDSKIQMIGNQAEKQDRIMSKLEYPDGLFF